MTQSCLKTKATSEAMTVLGKINKDFYCTMVFYCQDLGLVFQELKTY
jgi:hypothetical protein